jgi:hypothetical protein
MATITVNEVVTYTISGLTRDEMRVLDLALAYTSDHPEVFAHIQDKIKTAADLHDYILRSMNRIQ